MQITKSTARFAAAFALIAAALLSVVVLAAPAQAAEQPYSYTVRIYAGAQGSFNGKDYIEATVEPGARISFSQGDVQLNDNSKYYVRGIKESGRDNDTTLATPSFVVEGDADYVVSYGILGDNVAYTVRYVDTDGNELAPTETFYGNVGESPVLAYRYVEGYRPQAYNLTGELRADANGNVYTFTYERVTTPAQTGTTTPAEGEEGATAGAEGEATAPAADAAPGTTVVEGGAGEAIADDGTPLNAPEEIEDIRDDENPLAGGLEFLNLDNEAGVLLGAKSGILAAVLAVGAFLIFVYNRRKRQQDDQLEAAVAQAESHAADNGKDAGDGHQR